MDTVILGAVGAAVFPIAFLGARMCLAGPCPCPTGQGVGSQLSSSFVDPMLLDLNVGDPATGDR